MTYRRRQIHPHEDKLGVFLVEEYLGEHCGRVAHELSVRGRLSFPDLVLSLGKTPSFQELLPRSELYEAAGQPETISRPTLAPHEVGKAVAVLSHHGLIITVRAQPHNRARRHRRRHPPWRPHRAPDSAPREARQDRTTTQPRRP